MGEHVNGESTLVVAPARADLSIRFTPEQRQIILDTCCGGASESEARALLAVAEARGLNPILGECYFVKRYDKVARRDVWAVQASIDSLRIKAEQTGLYAGQDEPEYEYNDKRQLVLAKVRVWRKDWPRPAVGVARWSEYVQTTRDGAPTSFWQRMPHNQLAKCAEALALRKAFPAVLAKVYVPEEMAFVEQESDAKPEPKQFTQRQAETPPDGSPSPFQVLCEQLDAAQTIEAVNILARDAMNAWRANVITDGALESIKRAVANKRAVIKPPSQPNVAEVES